MGSLRLRDCILEVLAEGRLLTTRQIARRLGADPFTVEDVLKKLRRERLATRHPILRTLKPRLIYYHGLYDAEPPVDQSGCADAPPAG